MGTVSLTDSSQPEDYKLTNTVAPWISNLEDFIENETNENVIDKEFECLHGTLFVRRHSDGAVACIWSELEENEYKANRELIEIGDITSGGEISLKGKHDVADTWESPSHSLCFSTTLLWVSDPLDGVKEPFERSDGTPASWPASTAKLTPKCWCQDDCETSYALFPSGFLSAFTDAPLIWH